MSSAEASRGARTALVVALAAVAAAVVYPAVRTFERVVLPEPNPAALVWSERSPLVWRVVIALYAAGAMAFAAEALARRSPRAASRLLLVLVALAVVASALQGAFAP